MRKQADKRSLLKSCSLFAFSLCFLHFNLRYKDSCDVIAGHTANVVECSGYLFLHLCYLWYCRCPVMARGA